MDDEGTAHTPAGTVAQELVEDALGVGRGQAAQIQFQKILMKRSTRLC